MLEGDSASVERMIAHTTNETARGDPDAMAAHIVAALAEAGFRIVTANGRDHTALGAQRAEMTPLYRSPNRDSWFLARDPETGLAFVRHQANAPSGGQVTDIEMGAFISRPRNPERDALLRRVGALILNPPGAKPDDEPSAVNTGREWSDAELNELGNMPPAPYNGKLARQTTARLPLPGVLSPRVSDRLPLRVRNRVRAATGERHPNSCREVPPLGN